MTSDPIIEKNRKLMENIWQQIPKETNLPEGFKGEYIHYITTDPKFLYESGFVDEKKYTLEEWEAAFIPFKQEDGSYLISKEQFITLGKYKYVGHIKKPLDPMNIREGWYDIIGWREFFIRSVLPSTTLTIETFVRAEKILRENGLVINERVKVDKAVKFRIKEILDTNPSIARRRELSIEKVHIARLEKEAKKTANPSQKSNYEYGAKLGTQEKSDLSETLLKKSKITSSDNPKETISLKDLRKQSKKKKN